jgi:hypothetical protein
LSRAPRDDDHQERESAKETINSGFDFFHLNPVRDKETLCFDPIIQRRTGILSLSRACCKQALDVR